MQDNVKFAALVLLANADHAYFQKESCYAKVYMFFYSDLLLLIRLYLEVNRGKNTV